VSNPRYRPRDFAVHPRDFGRKAQIDWREPDSAWSTRERSQLAAAELQHRICFGVLETWMPRSQTRKITTLAAAIDMSYNRLQQILSGHIVMQFEDFGRLYAHIGPRMELWLLSGQHIPIAEAVNRTREREAQRRASEAQRPARLGDARGLTQAPSRR